MTDIVNEEDNTVQLPEEEQNTVVTDNGTTYESQESGIIAKEEADRAKQWAEESERQANIATTASTNAASSENLARVYKESAQASENYVRSVTTSTAFTNVSNDLSSPNSSIRTVSTNINNVRAVANIADDIDAVMDISEDITAVAGNSSNINTVATNSSDINTVASNISDINTVVVNITDIQNAYDNAQLAKDWAIKTNGMVDGSDYSAKYYAQQASTSATSASTSATSADTSATSASNSATSASTSATNASTSATSASNSATSATTSATSASTSASNAASSATLAQDWAIKTNGMVDGSEYSAKYYAQQAQQAASDVSNKANKDLSNLSSTGEARFTAKQNTLVSGTNIKTINGQSVLGSGDLTVTTSTAWGGITGSLSAQTDLQNALNAKQDTITDLTTIRSGASAGATAVQPEDLATVATSGDYADLSGKPTIPSDTNDLTNGAGYITSAALSGYAADNAVVHLAGTETITGAKTFTYNPTIQRNRPLLFMNDNWCTRGTSPSSAQYQAVWFGDTGGNTMGGMITLYNTDGMVDTALRAYKGASAESYIEVRLMHPLSGSPTFIPTNDNSYNLGSSSKRWKQLFAGTTTIATSDERLKQGIESVPDTVLDAWGEVEFYRYKFNDAVEEKGFAAARYHTGVVAQRIMRVFAEHGLNAFDYGLLCYDEWEAKAADVDESGKIIRPAQEAGNRYAVRYEECLCMEAAYQRRRADRIEKRLNYIDNLLKQNYNNEELTL